MDVSIVSVNYKTADYIIGLEKSIKEHSSGFSYEIIVVDNKSEDGSVEKILEAAPDIRVIESNINLGTTKAYNVAIKQAQGDYVFLINPDTLLLNNAIYYLLSYIRQHDDVGIVCGNLFDLDNNPTHSFLLDQYNLKYIKKVTSLKHVLRIKLFKDVLKNQFNYSQHPIEVGYACAAAMLMKTDIVKQVGMFDESIFMYGEEAVLCEKLRKHGFKTMNIPTSKIIHFEGGSFKDRELKKNSFSENKYKRYINGTYNAFELIDGPGSGLKYLQILLRFEKKYQFINCFLHNKLKIEISKRKEIILKELIEAYQKAV